MDMAEDTKRIYSVADTLSTWTIQRQPSPIIHPVSAVQDMTLGFYPEELTVIAGRPGQGKTSYATDILLANALKYPGLIVSLEMGRSQLLDRMLCNLGNVDFQQLRRGKLTGDEVERLSVAKDELLRRRIYFNDHSGQSIHDVLATIRMASEKGIRFVLIDYFTLLLRRPEEHQAAEASLVAQSIREAAQIHHIPICLLSQLNREIEKRPDPTPRLSDLHGGGLEQNADTVIFLYRPAILQGKKDDGKAKIVVAKQRNGPLGTVDCVFVGKYCSFRYDPEVF
jgi:replicative DNA helicase